MQERVVEIKEAVQGNLPAAIILALNILR